MRNLPRPMALPSHRFASARLSLVTLTPSWPIYPSTALSVAAAIMLWRSAADMPRALATRGTCHCAYATETYGSRPDAEAVRASSGTGPAASGLADLRSASRWARASACFCEAGERFEPPEVSPEESDADGRDWNHVGSS